MKEDGEIPDDGLHSSKRLRLSILRTQNGRRSHSLSDSAAPFQGASTSSSVVKSSPVFNCRAEVGATANVRESSIEAELALPSDYSSGQTLQITSLIGTDDYSALNTEANFISVSDTRQQPNEAGNGLLDVPCEVPYDFGIQQHEVQRGQLQDETVLSMESIPTEPGAELHSAVTGGLVVPPHEQADPLSFGEEETDDALQGGEFSGDGPRNDLEQEAGLFQEMELMRLLLSQQQDETFSHSVATFDQSGILPLGHNDVLETSLEVVEAHETDNAILHAEIRNQVDETIEISEDDVEAESADPAPSASALAETRLTAEDFDAFAPEPHRLPQPLPNGSSVEAGISNPEQLSTQLDSEGTICPICMEPWTNTGNHRICSLACGHLFGKACIKRWLKLAGRKQGKCPHCNKRAKVEDLRTLYVPRIAVIDGETQLYMQEAGQLRTENEQLKKQVVDLREEVRRTRTLFKALSGDQHDTFSTFGSAIPRPQDQRDHHMSQNRRLNTVHHASRPAPHRAHGSISQDHPSPQSGRSTREMPQGEHLSSVRISDESASRPVPLDQQIWRRFFGRNSSETGSHAGMVINLEQRTEENVTARPLRSFISHNSEENFAARPLRSFISHNSAGSRGLEKEFVFQDERSLNGAKVFDMDAQSQLLLVSGRPPDSIISSGLTKMSLLALSEGECINLPSGTGAIRDIRIAPCGTRAPGKLALVASLGKKLSLFSLESNNVVITYTLPNPSWACSWDPCNPNRVYTGLQNGTLLAFDIRQTSLPLDTLKGPSSTPIHTLQYVPEFGRAITREGGTSGSWGGGLLSASSNTLLFWPGIEQPQEKRPVVLSQPGGSSVCVSVSYNAAVDVMVASFRPKPTSVPLNGGASSSTPSTYSQADLPSQSTPSVLPESASTMSVGVHIPTHFSYGRSSRPTAGNSTASGTNNTSWEQRGPMVGHKSQAVLSRTAIVNEWTGGRPLQVETGAAGQNCLFASGDEGSNSVWLWDLSSPTAKQMLLPHPYSPVLDIRTAHIAGMDLLGCISERTLQLYRRSLYR